MILTLPICLSIYQQHSDWGGTIIWSRSVMTKLKVTYGALLDHFTPSMKYKTSRLVMTKAKLTQHYNTTLPQQSTVVNPVCAGVSEAGTTLCSRLKASNDQGQGDPWCNTAPSHFHSYTTSLYKRFLPT